MLKPREGVLMAGFMKVYRNGLLISVLFLLIFIFSISLKYQNNDTNFVGYDRSEIHILWKSLQGRKYSQIPLNLDPVNYTRGVEANVDAAAGLFLEFLGKKQPVFLSGFKNPCWYDEEDDGNRRLEWIETLLKRPEHHTWRLLKHIFLRNASGNTPLLRCLPYFMLIGQPKSGSTDLFKNILQHPDVKPGIGKEPHWWTRYRHFPYTKEGRPGDDTKQSRPCNKGQPFSFNEYLDYFNPIAETLQTAYSTQRRRIITGEGSQSTLWDHSWWWWYGKNKRDKEPGLLNAQVIRHIMPDVKLLVILRNPVDRAYSDYLYFSKNETNSVQSFHKKVTEAINRFHQCLETESLRHCVYMGNSDGGRLLIGLYAVYLKDWMDIFPQNQLLVLSLDEYSRNSSLALSKIYKFLELRDIGEVTTRAEHYNQRRPSGRNVGPMLNETRLLLERFYKPFNQALSLLMNDTAFLW